MKKDDQDIKVDARPRISRFAWTQKAPEIVKRVSRTLTVSIAFWRWQASNRLRGEGIGSQRRQKQPFSYMRTLKNGIDPFRYEHFERDHSPNKNENSCCPHTGMRETPLVYRGTWKLFSAWGVQRRLFKTELTCGTFSFPVDSDRFFLLKKLGIRLFLLNWLATLSARLEGRLSSLRLSLVLLAVNGFLRAIMVNCWNKYITSIP